MDELCLEEFAGTIGESYEIRFDDQTFALELKSAEPIPAHSLREAGSFSLLWRGPYDPILPQATYELHRGEESHWIFIVPIGRDESGTTYEAVFN